MFNSSFAREMTDYLELRTAVLSASSASNDRRVLLLLDQYLVLSGFQGKELTEDILSAWSKTLSGKSKTVKEKLAVVRGFGKYLNTLGHQSFLPTLPKVKSDYIPYIFSDEEIVSIFHYADNLTPQNPRSCSSFFQLKIPMALRILYSCGTRLQETMSLQRKDVDFKNRTLFLKKTKFSKERVIPVHESLIAVMERYCLTLGIMHEPEAFLFPGRKEGSHYTTRQMDSWFSEILKLALQSYNFGNGYLEWAKARGGYTFANAAEFSDMMAQRMGWSSYGDKQYVPHVLQYYAFGRIPTGIGNQAIVQVAASQEGKGGTTYWRWYGFGGRVEWCACFVSWCADQSGYIQSGVIPKFSLCSDGVKWFESKGRFRDGSYTPVAGDIIFFDWGNNGTIDHVGIVESVSGGTVNTIEGNSGDKVARRSYRIGSSNIYGYGVPAY